MFDEKEILEITNSLDINEDDFKDIHVNLNDIEKKRIKRKYKKSIMNKKTNYCKKAAVACGLLVTLYGGVFIAKPVNACNIPVLSSIYERLGVYDEYKDYSTYIGESQKIGKYTYTIEEMIVSIHKSVLAIKIESDEIIPENHDGFRIDSQIGGVRWDSSMSQNHRVNEKTIITTIEHFYYERIPNKSDVNISIYSIDECDANNNTTVDFSFKADFEKSYTESFESNVNGILFKENSAILIDEINSSIFGTSIVSKYASLKYIDSHRNYDLLYELKVDDKSYIAEVTNSTGGREFILSKGESIAEIEDLKVDAIRNAKNVSLLVYEPKEYNGETYEDEINEEYLRESMNCIKEYRIK